MNPISSISCKKKLRRSHDFPGFFSFLLHSLKSFISACNVYKKYLTTNNKVDASRYRTHLKILTMEPKKHRKTFGEMSPCMIHVGFWHVLETPPHMSDTCWKSKCIKYTSSMSDMPYMFKNKIKKTSQDK